MHRRQLLKNISLATASLPFIGINPAHQSLLSEWQSECTTDKVKDENFWKQFRKEFYEISDEFINLENGYFGVHPKPVTEVYLEKIRMINRYSSRYMRTEYNEDIKKVEEGLAQFSGVQKEELLVTRNATEAMNIIIQGLSLQKGDEVILSRMDYHSMIETFEMLEKQKGIVLRFVELPLLPESDEQIISIYNNAITNSTKCILLTHVIHLTGQIIPVRKLADQFKPLGIDIIVDAAHSFAQLDYQLPDLGVDFIGLNLHKWFSNPLGAGMLYVKKERIKDLQPLFGDNRKSSDDIRKLGHFGTLATPNILTIPTAQQFNEMVSLTLKEQRLRYLQNYWTKEAANISRVQVTTPTASERSCALASFKIAGMDTKEVVRRLYDEYGVFTVIRYLPNDEVVRVTPNLYNGTTEVDRLLEGIMNLAKN